MYMNKAIIIGNLTRDPELRAMTNGNKITSFSLATNRVWNDANGQKQEEVEYHNITVFGRQAETCAQYLKKGQQALVEGRLKTSSWEKDGVKKYRTDIIADRVQFGFKKNDDHNQDHGQEDVNQDAPEYPEDDINPDDIPF